jgi:hypothetical protein
MYYWHDYRFIVIEFKLIIIRYNMLSSIILSFTMSTSPTPAISNEDFLIETAGTKRTQVRIGTKRTQVRINSQGLDIEEVGTKRTQVRIGTKRTQVRI